MTELQSLQVNGRKKEITLNVTIQSEKNNSFVFYHLLYKIVEKMISVFVVQFIKVLRVEVADVRGHMFLDVGVGAGMCVGTCFWM